MSRALTALTLAIACATLAFAHTPTITPGKGKGGDLPPVLEDKPLPPFVVVLPSPIPGQVVPVFNP